MRAPNPWITYRTRFLVKAKQLNTSLAFTDVLGRLHSGRKGDYLVESVDGVLRIAPRQIFEDIYVPLMSDPLAHHSPMSDPTISNSMPSIKVSESMPITIPAAQPGTRVSKASKARDFFDPALVSCVIRKSPQPERRRRSPIPGARSL
jgi:hypothetical protein